MQQHARPHLSHALSHPHTNPHLQARTFFVSRLSAGLRTDTNDDMLEMRQRWRLADVRLEEYCFVVLSRVINALEEQVWGGRPGPRGMEEGEEGG